MDKKFEESGNTFTKLLDTIDLVKDPDLKLKLFKLAGEFNKKIYDEIIKILDNIYGNHN